MKSPVQHYKEAERAMKDAQDLLDEYAAGGSSDKLQTAMLFASLAQSHATLATYPGSPEEDDRSEDIRRQTLRNAGLPVPGDETTRLSTRENVRSQERLTVEQS